MNSISSDDKGLCARLAKNKEIAALLDDEATEWRGVVEFQAALNEKECFTYGELLAKVGKNFVTATVEERVAAFINAKMNR